MYLLCFALFLKLCDYLTLVAHERSEHVKFLLQVSVTSCHLQDLMGFDISQTQKVDHESGKAENERPKYNK